MQSSDGGFASYESTRASAWLEKVNPQETLGQCMVEHNYPECTSSVLTAFVLFRRHFPYHRAAEIDSSISHATRYILASQECNGSWYGAWAICYTYATYFALKGLEATHQTYQTSEHVRKACDWLVSVQKSDLDGGWGEHWSSCELMRYVQHEKSQIINTCWATLALMTARYPHKAVIERGLQVRDYPSHRPAPRDHCLLYGSSVVHPKPATAERRMVAGGPRGHN